MERYRTIDIIRHNGDGKRRVATMYHPEFPYRSSDIYIIARKLDRMDLVAHEYYNNRNLWWVIQRANNLPGGSFQLPPGKIIRVPWPLSSGDVQDMIIDINKR